MEDLKYEVLSDNFSQYDLSFKIIVIGDSGVGKSCLTMKATKNYFEEFYNPTVGFEFFTFNIRINTDNIKLQIWDTCGQEVYRSLITSFYRNSSLAVLVYSIDNENSYQHLESWINEIKTQANPDIKIFLIGNKADLSDQRKITRDQAETFAKEHDIKFFLESSAKTGLNAQNVFVEAAKELYAEHVKYKNRTSTATSEGALTSTSQIMDANNVLNDEEFVRKKKGCC